VRRFNGKDMDERVSMRDPLLQILSKITNISQATPVLLKMK
jgi:hypothetical protein